MSQGLRLAPAESDAADTLTLTRADLVETLGEFGAELFERMDPQHRNGEEICLLSVREARTAVTSARLPHHGKVVRPQRGASPGEDLLMLMSLRDIAEAFVAATGDYDWGQAFAPTAALPAAHGHLQVARGRRGRRPAL